MMMLIFSVHLKVFFWLLFFSIFQAPSFTLVHYIHSMTHIKKGSSTSYSCQVNVPFSIHLMMAKHNFSILTRDIKECKIVWKKLFSMYYVTDEWCSALPRKMLYHNYVLVLVISFSLSLYVVVFFSLFVSKPRLSIVNACFSFENIYITTTTPSKHNNNNNEIYIYKNKSI